MIFADRKQMQDLDRRTITQAGVPGHLLMERAGAGLADCLLRVLRGLAPGRPSVLFAAGKGNNGGDAFCAARHLSRAGIPCTVRLSATRNDISGDARTHLDLMLEAGVPLEECPEADQWKVRPEDQRHALVVDGLLGTGFAGTPREPVRSAIDFVNQLGLRRVVAAVDIPSGLDATEGVTQPQIVRADLTVTMGLPKRGFLSARAQEYVGSVEVVDIGIPQEFLRDVPRPQDPELIVPELVRPLFPPRARHAHKGNFGKVLIMGGSRRYSGAVIMAARAALRSGAGLVTVLVPADVALPVRVAVPEVIVETAPADSRGALSPELWLEWRERATEFNALLVGPGMTAGEGIHTLVRNVIRDTSVPLVADADAINVMAGRAHWFNRAPSPVVLTPHPAELARLLATEVAAIQADRLAQARRAAEITESTVVLKGAGTLVVAPDGRTAINLCGNPGMATAGSGDVLAGLLVGLLAQGHPPFEAACAAVFLHGKAGDLAAWRLSQPALTAMDICEELPEACKWYARP